MLPTLQILSPYSFLICFVIRFSQQHQKGLLPCPFIETLCRGLGVTLVYVCTSWEGTTFLPKLVEGTSILLSRCPPPPGTENIHYIRLSHWSHPFCSQQRGLGQTPEIPCPKRGDGLPLYGPRADKNWSSSNKALYFCSESPSCNTFPSP